MNSYIHYKPRDIIGSIVIDNARIYLSAAPRKRREENRRSTLLLHLTASSMAQTWHAPLVVLTNRRHIKAWARSGSASWQQ